jgi:hypothetical protein
MKSDIDNDTYYLECDCHSFEHMLSFNIDKKYNEVLIESTLRYMPSFFKRLKNGLRYAFNRPYHLCGIEVIASQKNLDSLQIILKEISQLKVENTNATIQ